MKTRTEKKFLVRKIKEGIVIDHLPVGLGFPILKILDLVPAKYTVVLAHNVESKKLGRKDILKVQNVWLEENKLKIIALLAPKATVNYIKNWKVERKIRMKIPKKIEGIIKCPNALCITNDEIEKKFIKTKFEVLKSNLIRCKYCGYLMSREEIASNLSKGNFFVYSQKF